MKKIIAFTSALVLVALCIHPLWGQPIGRMVNVPRLESAPSTAKSTVQRTATVPQSSQWTHTDTVNSIKVYRDERTGLEWTVTIGQVQSSGWGTPAQALVAKHGFRLPSFRELQVMESNGGFRYLNINNRAYQYYETSDSNILGNAFRNGFRTPQQRQGTGMNWVIGVRQGGGGGQGDNIPQGKIKVHLIVAGDVNCNLKGSVVISRNDIYSTLISGLGNTPFEYYEVPCEDLRPETILQFIKNCPIKKNDTVIFCYLGHGASDPNRGVFYTIADPSTPYERAGMAQKTNYLLKEDVKSQILRHDPRLLVLISDCCSVDGIFPEPAGTVGGANPDPPKPLFKRLFLDSSGIVDFTAAQQNHTGWASTVDGFWLTHNLCKVLDQNQQKSLSWTTFFPVVRESAKEYSLKQYNANPTNSGSGWNYQGILQIPMIPRAFSLGN